MVSNVTNSASPYAPINVTASFPTVDTRSRMLTIIKSTRMDPLFSTGMDYQP